MHAATPSRQLRITLLQERSAGTFARVYLAEATGDGGISRIVAVKVLKEQWTANEELLTRTRDEARLLARLHHKNILRVEAMAEIDGQPAIVMEFVDGIDLKQLIDLLAAERGTIPRRAVYRIALGATSALHAAYAKVPYGSSEPLRVVHRDLKPSNVMVSVEGEVKVLDFGTARFTHEARLAKTGVLRFGSMKYMSPERRLGDRGDHPSDVYALGLLLIEMLRGEQLPLLPIDATEHDEAMHDIVARLDTLGLPNAAWEESLRQMLLRMCHHKPEGRLDAGQVVELLRAFSDQAEGAGLESWSADVVSRLARQVFGDGIDGALSGSQVFVSMSQGGSGVGAEGLGRRIDPYSASGSSAAGGLAPASGQRGSGPPGVITRNGPTVGRAVGVHAPPGGALDGGAPMAGGFPLADEPTMVKGYDRTEPEADVDLGPAPPEARSPFSNNGLHEAPTRMKPPDRAPATAPPPEQAPPERIYAPAPNPAPAPSRAAGPSSAPAPRKGNRNVLVMALVGGTLVGMVGLVALAGVGWYLFGGSSTVVQDGGDEPTAEASGQATEDAAAVRISVAGDQLQWLKVATADGAPIGRIDDANELALAPGDYQLTAKAVGRPKVSGTLPVDGPAEWACQRADKGRVTCTSDAGAELVLE